MNSSAYQQVVSGFLIPFKDGNSNLNQSINIIHLSSQLKQPIKQLIILKYLISIEQLILTRNIISIVFQKV